MTMARLRGIRVKMIEADIAEPDAIAPGGVGDVLSLEEKLNTWLASDEAQTLNLVEIRYQAMHYHQEINLTESHDNTMALSITDLDIGGTESGTQSSTNYSGNVSLANGTGTGQATMTAANMTGKHTPVHKWKHVAMILYTK